MLSYKLAHDTVFGNISAITSNITVIKITTLIHAVSKCRTESH